MKSTAPAINAASSAKTDASATEPSGEVMMKVSGISEVPRSLHASAHRRRHRTFADPPPAAPLWRLRSRVRAFLQRNWRWAG